MNYSEVQAWLETVIRTGIKYDLVNIRRLLALLGHPERDFPVVSVTGTNGKGSVCAFLESILAEAGYRAGLNTSPHLVSPRERLRINRTISSEEEFTQALSAVREASESGWRSDDPGRPTFFETMTAAALVYFRIMKVDIALMEAGLGGRLDGTNGTQPILSVITRIGIDHPKTLGRSLRKIAFEKFGLARAGKPLLIAQQRREVERYLAQLARFRGAQAVPLRADWNKVAGQLTLDTGKKIYSGIQLSLPGDYQKENAACAVRAAELLASSGFRIDEDAIRSGLSKAFWPGRMELKDGEPRLLLDGSHNADGMKLFIHELQKIPARRRILIYATMADKSIMTTGGRLLPHVDRAYLPPLPVRRAADPRDLVKQLEGINPDLFVAKSVEDAWERAAKEYRQGDLIIVAGSLYLVGELKRVTGDVLG